MGLDMNAWRCEKRHESEVDFVPDEEDQTELFSWSNRHAWNEWFMMLRMQKGGRGQPLSRDELCWTFGRSRTAIIIVLTDRPLR